jgi:hypothetical protein
MLLSLIGIHATADAVAQDKCEKSPSVMQIGNLLETGNQSFETEVNYIPVNESRDPNTDISAFKASLNQDLKVKTVTVEKMLLATQDRSER